MTKSTKPKAPWTRAFPKQYAKLMKMALSGASCGKTLTSAVAMGCTIPDGWPPYSKPTPKPRKSPRRAIRRRSVALTVRMKAYNVIKEKFLKKHPICAIWPMWNATTIHHSRGKMLTKKGDLLLAEKWFVPCSMDGHRLIEDNKAWARTKTWKKTGIPLLAPYGQFNTWKD